MASPDSNKIHRLEEEPQAAGAVAAWLIERLRLPEDVVRLSRDTVLYGFGKVAEAAAMLAPIPALTRAFTPAEFGLWDVIMTFFLLATTAASLALEVSLSASYFEHDDEQSRRTVAATSVFFRLISSGLFALVIYLFAPQISLIIFATAEHAVCFRIVAGALPFFLAISIFKQLLRITFAPWRFNVIAVGHALVYAGIGIFLVLRARQGVNGILFATLIAAACFSVIGATLVWKLIRGKFSLSVVRHMLAFSLPFLPSLFACWIIDFSGRYFLTRFGTLGEVGIYSVGAKISSLIILFTTSFQMAWLPFGLSIQHQSDAKKKYSRVLFFFLVVALTAGTAIVVFAKPILIVLTQPRYYGAEIVIPFLVLATVMYGAYMIINIGLIITRRSSYSSIAIAAGAGVNIALNFLLVPGFGMIGAAVATLVSYTVSTALLYWFARKYYPVDYRIPRIAKLVALAVGTMIVAFFVNFESSMLVDSGFSAVLFAVFLICLHRFFLAAPDEQ